MTTSRRYTLITPRADRTGPTNVAVEIGRAAAAAGWQVRLLYLSGEPSRSDLAGFAEVRRLRLRDLWQLDGVVHTHCLRPDLVGWAMTWNRQTLVMTTIHNYFKIDLAFDHPRWAVWATWFLWSRALRRFAHRVCISVTMQRYYRRLLPGLELDLAYNFRAPTTRMEQDAPPQVRAWLASQRKVDRLVTAYVGSLSARKNVASLLDALASTPEISLVLCGDGPLGDQLRARAARPDLFGRVMFAGHVGEPLDIVRECDLLVLPSFAEGLPLVVIEAAQIGRPTLMSNIAVHRELASIGLGATFDHRRFGDFGVKAHALAGKPNRPANPALTALWRDRFSPEPGFRQYADLARGSSA